MSPSVGLEDARRGADAAVNDVRAARSTPRLVVVGLLASAAMLLAAAAQDGEAEEVFTFRDERIVESSGLAVSPTQDVVWTVNDSGDEARVYGVDRDGCTRLDVMLGGVEVRDVEDLAVDLSTTPAELVVADVGDNRAVRDAVAIIRVVEPAVDLGGACPTVAPVVTLDATLTRVVLDDGPADVETLLVDPTSGDVLLVTKVPDVAPQVLLVTDGRAVGVAEPDVGDATPAITGGDISHDGRVVVLRSYRRAWTYEVLDDWPATFAVAASDVRLPIQPQGEAIAWDGTDAWLVSSEDPLGTRPPVLRVPTTGVRRRQPVTPTPTPTASTPPATVSPEASTGPAVIATPEPSPSTPSGADLEPAPAGRGALVAGALLVVVVAAIASALVAVVVRMGRRREDGRSGQP